LTSARRRTGRFERTAEIYAHLYMAIAQNTTMKVSAVQLTAVSMILMKIARVAAGNPNEPDHWADISGYAQLVLRSLEKEGGNE
jgi:hypothetical protein